MIIYAEKYTSEDIKELLLLYKENKAKNKIDEKEFEALLNNSAYIVLAKDEDRVIGFVRVLSDKIEWTLITDVIVNKEYQNQGIQNELVKRVLEKFKNHEIFIVADKESIGFFEDIGFKRSKNAFTYAGYNEEFIEDNPGDDKYLPLGYRYETEFYPFKGEFPVGQKSNRNIDNIEYSTNASNIDYERINNLLIKAFGSGRDANHTQKAFENSQYFAFAYDFNIPIACARAVSDKKERALILNVAVDPSYQGLHIGQKVVDLLCEQMKGQNIFLNTHPGGVGFYSRKPYLRNKTALLYPAHPDMSEEIAKGFVLPKGYRFENEWK